MFRRLSRLKKSTSPVLPKQSSTLKNHAQVFLVPLSLLAKTWLNLAEGQYFIPSLTEALLIIMKMKTVILALVSIIYYTSTPSSIITYFHRNNSSSVTTPRHSHSSFLENVSPNPTSVMPNDCVVVANGQPTFHQGIFFALVYLSVISGSQIERFIGIAFFWRKFCVLFYTF